MEFLRDLAKICLYPLVFALIILLINLLSIFLGSGSRDLTGTALITAFSIVFIVFDLTIVFLCLGLVYKKLVFYLISLLIFLVVLGWFILT